MRQVIATDASGALISPDQLAAAGVKPGDRVVVEVRAYTKADFERDDAGRVYTDADEFVDSLETYTQLPDAE